MKILYIHFLILVMASIFHSASVIADVRLPRILSDGAVLQRDQPIRIWGWADENEKISVIFAGQEKITTAKNGEWAVTFSALKAGGDYQLQVTANNKLIRNHIVMGDVWIASGQSNMELPLYRLRDHYPQVLSATNQPYIREFNLPVAYSFKGPEKDYQQGQWKSANIDNIASFSAVGFFFAQSLYQQTQVPIGLISIAVGGSPAEAWMSEGALAKYPHYIEQLRPFKDDAFVKKTIETDKASNDKWHGELNAADKGLNNHWSAEKLDTKDWQSVLIPGFLKEQGFDLPNGSFWVRKTFHLTEAQAKKSATLWLGCVVDGDQVFLNGQSIGQTGYQYPPRIYSVPANLLKAGDNNLSVRVVSYSGNPGFVKEKPYALDLGDEKIALSGEWKMQIAAAVGAMNKTTTLHYQPASLFNAKLAPALPLKIKGVIWYQGESNVGRAKEYQQLFPDLITDWRKQFNQGNFPFLYVQLANFLPAQEQPSESGWAELREAQRKTLVIKNTAMTVALDIGEWNDIHPLNKKEVGDRLALSAMTLAYGKKSIVFSGPLVKSARYTTKNKSVEIKFDSADGLNICGDKIQTLAIAGADKKYIWTTAVVEKNRLIVDTKSIPDPKWVRYAWADNPEGANLYNAAGLPASSFEIEVN